MIRITCTHCRQVLTIDDGFAGGVCRCQHCGTIQTVPPAPGKSPQRGATPAAKTLYRSDRRRTEPSDDPHHGSGSGLDQLAEFVSSSGLRHTSRLRRPSSGNGMDIPEAVPKRKSLPLLPVGIGVLIGLLVILVILLIRHYTSLPR